MVTKPLSALRDALRAMELDPRFMRAASRAATCHCRWAAPAHACACLPSLTARSCSVVSLSDSRFLYAFAVAQAG